MSREHEDYIKHVIFRQIDTTVIVSACFPLVENIVAWLFQRRGRKWTNQVTMIIMIIMNIIIIIIIIIIR